MKTKSLHYSKHWKEGESYWQKVESYIGQHSEAQFSHGICPDCARKYYPEFHSDDKKNK